MNDSPPTLVRRRGRPARACPAPAREALLEKALALFVRDGFEGVSLRRLAAELGISDPLLIHHFGSKEGLWTEAVDLAAERMTGRLRAVLAPAAPAADPLARVLDSVEASLHLARQRADVLCLAFREEGTGSARARDLGQRFLMPYLAHVDSVLEEARVAGLMDAVNLTALHAMILGAVRVLVVDGMLADRLAAAVPGGDPRAAYVDGVMVLLRRALGRP